MPNPKKTGIYFALACSALVGACGAQETNDIIVDYTILGEDSGMRINCTQRTLIRDNEDAPGITGMQVGTWYDRDSAIPLVKKARENKEVIEYGSLDDQTTLMFDDSFIDFMCKNLSEE